MIKLTPRRLRRMINWYPPYIGAGIRMEHVSQDFRRMRVSMKLRWYNRNARGVHFGGSLYAMVDPHLVLMLMGILGERYNIWDKSAVIDYIRPGRGKVTADFQITDQLLEDIERLTAGGGKYLPEFELPIIDESGETVALVRKTIYIRRNRSSV